MPMPNVVCSTRSPAASVGISRIRGLAPYPTLFRHSWLAEVADVFRQLVTAGLGSPPVDQLARNLVEEPAWRIVLRRPPRRPGDRAGDVEPLASPGDADVREPPLLRQFVARTLRDRSLMRENAVFAPGQEDGVELQTFGRVQASST